MNNANPRRFPAVAAIRFFDSASANVLLVTTILVKLIRKTV